MGPMQQAMADNPQEEQTEPVDNAQEEGGEEQASPEEQQQYDEVVHMAEQIIYSKQGDKFGIEDKLRADPDPIKAIGHTAAMIGLTIKNSVEQTGGQVSDEVLLNASQEIIADLIEIAQKMGLIKGEVTDQMYATAIGEAVKQYGEAQLKLGMIDEKQRADAQATFAEQLQSERGARGPARRGPPSNLAGAMGG